ncbi:MAG TPA: hypothetical protein DHV72_21060 [Serratia grimesii]|uniref:Uncharacterized protein n=1 Tax=Serratia grimesii TaxID=82995 RepID=A0A9C7V8B0_9GAMM|nr:hypothetical protein [Serratia grimesii]
MQAVRPYPSYLKLPLCWLHLCTPVTYVTGVHKFAAAMQRSIFWVQGVFFISQCAQLFRFTS